MGASKPLSPAPARPYRAEIAGKSAVSLPLAQNLTAAHAGRHFTPKELSAALAEAGITLGPRAIQARTRLVCTSPLYIASNPRFPGRVYIPAAELTRLLTGAEVGA